MSETVFVPARTAEIRVNNEWHPVWVRSMEVGKANESPSGGLIERSKVVITVKLAKPLFQTQTWYVPANAMRSGDTQIEEHLAEARKQQGLRAVKNVLDSIWNKTRELAGD